MSDPPTSNKARAIELAAQAVRNVHTFNPRRPIEGPNVMLSDAIEQDLDAASEEAIDLEARLVKVERQVRVLSDALIVVAAHSEAGHTAAVKAITDEL
jgi:hypothetical protein